MRFLNQPVDVFERVSTADEQRDLVRMVRIPRQDNVPSALTAPVSGNIQLDTLAVQVYGNGEESSWYRIGHRNVREIVGWRGDFEFIRVVDIPAVDAYL